jgi:IQ domain-containing protein H
MGAPSISFMVEPDGEVTLTGSMDRFTAREYINSGCMFPQQSLPNMNMMTISKSIGEVLYSKGIFGHVTVDLVSFPDPTSPTAHPLFWAIDLNCGLTDYATSCAFFDFLMEGKLDQFTGKYTIDNNPFNANDSVSSAHSGVTGGSSKMSSGSKVNKRHGHSTSGIGREAKDTTEQRCFMYCKYLHHPGLASIQYKSFFHMCRLESISFDLERR